MPKKTYEGLQENIRKLKTPVIDIIENKYPDREYLVHLSTEELTCICPKTGLPDFAAVNIHYKPAAACIELKSFKYYLIFYRNVGIFHEHLTNKILDDIYWRGKVESAQLKELIGHTPVQVFVGSLMGFAISLFLYYKL